MRKIYIIIVLMSISLLSCSKEEIKIGFAGSLSGSGHELGVDAKNGFQMAVDEFNNNGGIRGRKILPIIKDDQSNTERALVIVDDFAHEEIDIVVGFITSNMVEAVNKGLDKGMLFISPSISTPLLSEKDDFFIRTVNPMEFEARELARHIYANNVKKLAIVYDMSNDVYAKRYYEFVSEEFLDRDTEIVYIKALYDTDYDTIVSKIKDSDAQGLCLVTSSHNAAEILQRLKLKDMDMPIALSQWTMATELMEKGGKAVEGAFGLSTYNNTIETQAFLDFKEAYKSRFKQEPTFISITSYESTKILLNTLLETRDHKKIKSLIVDNQYQGLQDSFLINEYGDGIRKFYIVEIQDGDIVPK